MICFYCNQEIESISDAVYIPIEKPYVNLLVHKDTCFKEIQAYGEQKFLLENPKRVYEYAKRITNGKGK